MKSLTLISLGLVLAATPLMAQNNAPHRPAGPPLVGAYGGDDLTNPTAKEAAKFAVETRSAKIHTQLKLDAIKHAHLQVVAGLNIKLCLKISHKAKHQYAEAIVYKDVRQNNHLTSWKVLKNCD